MEAWKNIEIEGFEGFYQVSDCGNVRSVDRTIIQNGRKSRFYSGKSKAQMTDKKGYKYVTFQRKTLGIKKNLFVTNSWQWRLSQIQKINHK